MKITPEHLNPGQFKKMSCKLALQIFSNSVSAAAAIRTVYDNGQLKSDTATATADFLQYFNSLFDALNSKTLFSGNPYSCALSKENPLIEETLLHAIDTMKSLYKLTSKGPTRPPSFDGLIWSLTSILSLYEQQKLLGFPYLLTNRSNQDIIENSFAQYCQRGGYNLNPTVKTFRTTFRISAKMNLMKPSKISNCESDDRELLITKPSLQQPSEATILEKNGEDILPSSPSTTSSNSSESVTIDFQKASLGSLEDCSRLFSKKVF